MFALRGCKRQFIATAYSFAVTTLVGVGAVPIDFVHTLSSARDSEIDTMGNSRVSLKIDLPPEEVVDAWGKPLKFPSTSSREDAENTLRVLTYNVWFDRLARVERTSRTAMIIVDAEPDLVMLQEVTQPTLDQFRYLLSETYPHVSRQKIDGYAEVIFSRFPLSKVSRTDFSNSHMGRGYTQVHLNNWGAGRTVSVTTSHLESMPGFEAARATQIEQVLSAVKPKKAGALSIFGGDCNFLSESENPPLKDGWVDAWIEGVRNRMQVTEEFGHILGDREALRYRYGELERHAAANLAELKEVTEELKKTDGDLAVQQYEGFTFDVEQNVNVGGPWRNRLDRLYVNGGKVKWIRMVGKETITTSSGAEIQPSDHFGLLMDVELIESG